MAVANFYGCDLSEFTGQLIAFQIQALQTFIMDWLTHFKANEFMNNHQ